MAKNDLTADANESDEPQDDTRSDDARNDDALNEDVPNDDAPSKDDIAPWTGTDRRAPTRAAAELCAREQLLALIQAMFSQQGRARLIGIYDVRVVHSALFDLGFLSDPRDAVAAGPHPIYDNAACRIPEFAAALEAVDPTT